ncbi:hypothetical protein [Corynebacterium pseudodiphtheriticum]|uniref:hypothetical protein n=1 Tax=Corynebacterium pseudodiphtheriticum TaxID=37637 RepID=UPI0020C11ABA|nr:hypothetical protein [Corynebacterium pseudodiphtheriticum]UQV53740.1 hypothetical protein L2D23_08315 [Corynebacterium pseudodiphtheriticum]
MPNREFRLMTFLYVDPVSEIQSAIENLNLRCKTDPELSTMKPRISKTDIPGRLQVVFRFLAENPETAEDIAGQAIKQLTAGQNSEAQRENYMQGSNTLSLA